MSKLFSTILVFLFISTAVLAQDFKGVAVYQSKTKLDIQLDSTQIPKERLNDFKEMLKSQLEKKFVLTFDKFAGIYKEEEKLEQPGRGGMRMMGAFNQGIYYKNLKEKKYVRQIESFSKEFLIKDSLKPYEWKLEEESKMIGEHLCFKATATKEVRNIRMGPPPPPNEGDAKQKETPEKEEPKTKIITVTAWYTPEIPINNGPSDYWGLPGLILELSEENTVFLCTEITLNAKDAIDVKEPEKGKEVTQKEYDQIMEDKMKEMQEMYGGQERKNEGGGGHRMIIRM
jgi:GLPGLI family protein